MNEYDKDTEIDFLKLDVALMQQADLSFKYGKLWADAVQERDNLKQKRELLKAEITLKIAGPDVEKKERPTVAQIDAMVISDKKYIALTTQMSKAEYDVNIFSVAKTAMADKKAAINDLCWLYANNYMTSNALPKAVEIAVKEENKKQAEQEQKDGLNNEATRSRLKSRKGEE